MAPDSVVIVVDPVDGALPQIGDGRPRPGVDEFLLVGREERLRNRVVITRAGPTQGSPDIVSLTVPVELCRGVLRSMPLS